MRGGGRLSAAAKPGPLDAPWGPRDIFSHEATFLSPGSHPGLAGLKSQRKGTSPLFLHTL